MKTSKTKSNTQKIYLLDNGYPTKKGALKMGEDLLVEYQVLEVYSSTGGLVQIFEQPIKIDRDELESLVYEIFKSKLKKNWWKKFNTEQTKLKEEEAMSLRDQIDINDIDEQVEREAELEQPDYEDISDIDDQHVDQGISNYIDELELTGFTIVAG